MSSPSSSAGVAMAMTAVNAGNMPLTQAAAMVIGMDFGTTVTALMATIGGTVYARRTGLAHVIYNLMTAAGAFLLLTPYMWALDQFVPRARHTDPELALVAFHTMFNILGVVVILPFTRRFGRLIERLVSERGNPLTRRLDPRVREVPELAITAVEATVRDLVAATFSRLADRLLRTHNEEEATSEQVNEAIEPTGRYLGFVTVAAGKESIYQRQQAAFHILDHLRRLIARLSKSQRIDAILDI